MPTKIRVHLATAHALTKKKCSIAKRLATKWSHLLSGKEILSNGTDLIGRGGQMMTWYPSMSMVLRNKQGHITAWYPATETEDCDIVMISRSNPEWTKDVV